MQTRQLGNNGPNLTVVGFGAWAIGGPWQFGWGKVDDDESIKAIHAAIDSGINWIDTAAVYGFGHSEEVVGKALEGIRDKVFIATKCGLVNDGEGNAINNLQPESIRKEMEASLKRLKVDCVDLYQIHKPDPNVPEEDSWEVMLRLQEEGKAKYVGLSTYNVPMIEKCLKVGQVQSLQPPFSMIKRDVEKDLLPFCLKNEIGVVVYSPMQAGLLSGTFDMSKIAVDDWRRKSPFFAEPKISSALKLVEKLRPIAARQNKTVGHLAISWVLKNSAITSAIVGARTAAQVKQNVDAANYIMTDVEFNEVTNLVLEHRL